MRLFTAVYIGINLPLAIVYFLNFWDGSIPFTVFSMSLTWSYLQGAFDAIACTSSRQCLLDNLLRGVRCCCSFLPEDSFEGRLSEKSGYSNSVLLANEHVPPMFTLASVFSRPEAQDFTIQFKLLQLSRPIGSGGSGMVWKGHFSSQPVAIKQLLALIISPEMEDAAEEFRHESSILAKLRHPNIV
jgi:hypothetical protein